MSTERISGTYQIKFAESTPSGRIYFVSFLPDKPFRIKIDDEQIYNRIVSLSKIGLGRGNYEQIDKALPVEVSGALRLREVGDRIEIGNVFLENPEEYAKRYVKAYWTRIENEQNLRDEQTAKQSIAKDVCDAPVFYEAVEVASSGLLEVLVEQVKK